MTGSIIHTALTNSTLRLELEYRVPSVLKEGNAGIDEPTNSDILGFQHADTQVWDEFTCLLRLI